MIFIWTKNCLFVTDELFDCSNKIGRIEFCLALFHTFSKITENYLAFQVKLSFKRRDFLRGVCGFSGEKLLRDQISCCDGCFWSLTFSTSSLHFAPVLLQGQTAVIKD